MARSGQRRLAPWLAASIAVILLAAPGAGVRAQQAGNGTISGQLVMGTAGGTIEGAPLVQVVAYRDGQEQETREATPDGENRYRFTNLPTGAGYEYVPFVDYQGVIYAASPLTLDGAEPATANITVYEPTEEQSVLRVLRDTVVFVGADAQDRRVSVLEFVEFENRSDRSYLPSATGPAGPMGLLRFGLPPGARDLQPLGQLAAYEIAAVDLGFATTMPVQPGRTVVSFSYLIDYGGLRGEAFQYEKPLPYATDRVTVLAGDPRLSIDSPALRDAGPVSIGDQTYQQYDSVSAPVAGPLPIAIRGLPGMLSFDPSGPGMRYAGLALAIALAGGTLIVGLAGGRFGRRPVTGETPAGIDGVPGQMEGANGAPAAAVEASLLLTTARLDLDFERGRIPEDVYRRERAALKHRLVELLRQTPSEPAVVGEKASAGDVSPGPAATG